MQLRADVCPITAENFRLLVTEELGYGIRMTRFHNITAPEGLYGGDFMGGTGTESASVFLCTFGVGVGRVSKESLCFVCVCVVQLQCCCSVSNVRGGRGCAQPDCLTMRTLT